eukprot:TRINITY_DN15726_c0_g1_i3.p1 TRINITY_DN15726_c0_g1~~TRINITY_DN15726_c0_g1_i3.p1  ORF type:complete len:460 (-),score=86.28 TRINITY_DN15726_c0_g1_i3:39-1418(-)
MPVHVLTRVQEHTGLQQLEVKPSGHIALLRHASAWLERGRTVVVPLQENITDAAAKPAVNSASIFNLWNLNTSISNVTEKDDVFGDVDHSVRENSVNGVDVFGNVSTSELWIFLITISMLMLLDFFVLRKLAHKHTTAVFFRVLCATLYGAHWWTVKGTTPGIEWFFGYLLELILSIDNVFVFQLIFAAFRVPENNQHTALFFGIIGALLMRLLFFFVMSKLVVALHWLRVVFGLILISSGIQATYENDEEEDITNSATVRFFQGILGTRQLSTFDQDARILVTDEDGRWCLTMLFPIIVMMESADLIFAVDSLSAKVARLDDHFAAYTSSAFAIFALRAMTLVLMDLIEYFSHLKYGICIILVFIGSELMLCDFVKLPTSAVTLIILAVFFVSIVSSIQAKQAEQRRTRRASLTAEAAAAAAAAHAVEEDDTDHEGEENENGASKNEEMKAENEVVAD